YRPLPHPTDPPSLHDALPIYQRMRTAPQVNPPPIASIITRSPFLMRPSSLASQSASGTEAAEVFACLSTVTTVLASGMPSLRPRSEEHTSELQSRENLVCRLL